VDKMSGSAEKKKKIFLFGAAGLLAVLIIILLFQSARGDRRAEQKINDIQKLHIPRDFTDIWDLHWYFHRSQKVPWTDEMVDLYWFDTQDVLIRSFEKKNDVFMSELYRSRK